MKEPDKEPPQLLAVDGHTASTFLPLLRWSFHGCFCPPLLSEGQERSRCFVSTAGDAALRFKSTTPPSGY